MTTVNPAQTTVAHVSIKLRIKGEHGTEVRIDQLDATALCQHPERFEHGNKKTFSSVRILNVDKEREREMTQQRQQLVDERQPVAGMGHGLPALHNI